MTNLSYQRPSVLAAARVPVPGVAGSFATRRSAHVLGGIGWAAREDLIAVARQRQLMELLAVTPGTDGSAAKDESTAKPAASGVPPRGRPV